jgi:hypothetical protein
MGYVIVLFLNHRKETEFFSDVVKALNTKNVKFISTLYLKAIETSNCYIEFKNKIHTSARSSTCCILKYIYLHLHMVVQSYICSK